METLNEKQMQQVAEIQLTYKSNVKPSMRPKISGSRDAYEVLKSNWDPSRIEFLEQFKVMLLNRANKVLGILEVSTGGVTGTVADPKVIFAAALKACACGLIVAHNHPSGNLTASQSDIDLTKKLKQAGQFLELPLLDHVIVTSEGYFSFADEGLI
ncbi:MAG: JAB domain-containing protein [Bacteroidetes bacterium]|nr:JAB domain-containing protein [Bacteroidota bacterium]MBS1977887.1 JAB domain-containing protein [Bacteroidota bacterium]